MSKITLEAPFRSFRGKVCKHSDIIYKEMYGTQFTSRICNPYTGEPSTAQIAQRTRFATAKANVAALTTDEIDAYKDAFQKQKKYRSLQGYMLAQEMEKI